MDESQASPNPEPVPTRAPRRLRLWTTTAVPALMMAAWLGASFLMAYKLTARRHPPHPEPPPQVSWARFEGLRLKTTDGQEIGGWFAEGREDAPGVLFLHGNGGGRAHCLSRAKLLVEDLGCAAMLISMRAHGDSTGDFNDIGFSARRDVTAAVDYLEKRRPGRPIVILGVSLGSAAAAFAAGELGERVAGYVLESPFADLKTAVGNRTRAYLPTPLDRIAYLGLRTAGLAILPNLDAIAPAEAVADVPDDVPVLVLAGEADDLATPAEARAVFNRVRSHARLETFPGADHKNLAEIDPPRYRRILVEFVAEAAREAAAPLQDAAAAPQ